MMSSWRRRRAARRAAKNHTPDDAVDRIPTPRIPVTSHEVTEIFARIEGAKHREDGEKCRYLAFKMKELAKESERNKNFFISNGATRVLSTAFETFSHADQNVTVLAEILSVIIRLTPLLDEETSRNLSSPSPLRRIVWFLRFGNPSGRRNAVLALKSVLSLDYKVGDVVKMEGVLEALVKLIKEPICPTTTKASLLAIYYIVKPFDDQSEARWNEKEAAAMRLSEMGLVQMLLELAVDSERSMCEKVLGVLDGICSYDEVRERERENGLMIPVLVKKLLRVSELATEFSVSILWKFAREEEEERVVVEAVGMGGFEKLLVVLQIGGDEVMKEKVSELLKRMNVYRNRVEYCVDSLDFKHLKKPF